LTTDVIGAALIGQFDCYLGSVESLTNYQKQIEANGYAIVNHVFSAEEADAIAGVLKNIDPSKANFRKTADLFAIRQLFREIPDVQPLIFTEALHQLIERLFGGGYYVVKSIYFDKPAASNWFVAYHQDLTISVKEKVEVAGFASWTKKQDQYAVQPPLQVLEQNFTIRIHLDDTDAGNGALRVIPGSHKKGVYRPETIDWTIEKESVCPVQKGGVMIMRPLLLHASSRTTNDTRRRVIHIEFSNQELPAPLSYSEYLDYRSIRSWSHEA
jgi:ectoine hydroxylase-related dioxygenase (phytanoyl-CoA dioxygenase family)